MRLQTAERAVNISSEHRRFLRSFTNARWLSLARALAPRGVFSRMRTRLVSDKHVRDNITCSLAGVGMGERAYHHWCRARQIFPEPGIPEGSVKHETQACG